MEKIPEELWTYIGQFLNQEKVLNHLYSRLRITNDNLNQMMEDNISLQHQVDNLNQQLLICERLQLMQQRQNSRLKRRCLVLRTRIDILENHSGSRSLGPIIDRSFNNISSDEETVIVEVSDEGEVDV